MESRKVPARKDGRVIIHFDYDCFYAAVFEAKNPALKSLPFAVQQKHIIVTCNYEARRRGLHKLQLIKDARRICPDVIIELGEDISRFRDASKELYNFIKDFSWNGKVERLGFDEVWMDVTDNVEYNMGCLNRHDLEHSFFQVGKDDPTDGFGFDATTVAGHTSIQGKDDRVTAAMQPDELTLRLRLGSHLALYIRHKLEEVKGYTSTVGVATNKLLSKLVGNLNKPRGQTTLMPWEADGSLDEPVAAFMDWHEIGKVPGIGFKLAQKLRDFVLYPVKQDATWAGDVRHTLTVAQVRQHSEIDYEKLEKLLGGPGSPHGIGYKVWCLLHGIDDTEVSQARAIPRQISIEDSYIRLDTMPELIKELNALARSLITRMRIDLLTTGDDFDQVSDDAEAGNVRVSHTLVGMKWLAHPKTLRLSTRPRQPLQQDGTRMRAMNRISHSCPLPNFVFLLNESVEILAEKLSRETLLTMFRKLHPEKSWWNLSLVNLAVTNMAEAAGDSKTANGRDIGTMFKRQDEVLKDFRVIEEDAQVGTRAVEPSNEKPTDLLAISSPTPDQPPVGGDEGEWIEDDGAAIPMDFCQACGSNIPSFAMVAHQRFHLPAAS